MSAKTAGELSKDESNAIAHAIAEEALRKEFHLMSNGEYRRRLGQKATELGVSFEKLDQFLLNKLSKSLSVMFGAKKAGITLVITKSD